MYTLIFMLKTAKIVGLNSDTNSALALISRNTSGLYLFLIVSCSSDDSFSRTRSALFEAEDLFNGSTEKISQRLSEIVEAVKTSLKDTENLQILAAGASEGEASSLLYMICLGEDLNAYLVRDNKNIDLCKMVEPGHLLSGPIEEGDRLIFTTNSLLEILGDDFESMGGMALDGIEDEVTSRLPQAQDYPLATIVIEKEKPFSEEEGSPDIEPVASSEKNVFSNKGLLLGNLIKRTGKNLLKVIPRSKRSMALVGVFILIVIIAGVTLNIKKQKDAAIYATFDSNFKIASEEFSKAQSFRELDADNSVKSLNNAKTAINEALKIKPQDTQALELKKQIENSSPDILKVFQVDDFPLWLDLDLVKKDFLPKNLSFSLGKVLVVDSNKSTLASIKLDSKAHELLAGQDKLGQATAASLNGGVAWVFSKNIGVIRVEANKISTAVKIDKDWGNITDIYGFGGNIYLLDDKQIWKYLPTESGYSDKRAYLKEEVKADFAGAKRLQIDSSVWVLKANGEIVKYTQGSPDYFSLNGLDKPIKDPQSIFVADTTDNLYVLDSGNSRLLVLDKKGVYVAQYQSDKLQSFTDLVVDEKGKKVYLLLGSKIFQMELH